MSTHCIHYGEHVEHVETPDIPHHLEVGGYPELVAEHCKLEERVAKLEERLAKLEAAHESSIDVPPWMLDNDTVVTMLCALEEEIHDATNPI